MPRLVVEKGSDKGRTISLSQKGTLLIGRDSSASVQLRDTMASRMHFKIESRDDGYWLIDLDSMNGTLLNGQPVRESKLAYGDLIKIGETLFSFLSDDASAGSLTGQRIGGYRIIERVGRGGMGTVYKAEQIDLQRIVALKVISEENSRDKEFVDLFIHEARAAAKLNHPNLVQVYDVKRTNDIYYFSMEFVGGGSVQDLLSKSKKIPAERSVAMILDSAKGLDYAHKKGIIHRDIKPDNLMISEDGQIKIGDMGLARTLGEKIGPSEENCVIGTPHYIAPEQVLGKEADYRSDIYALGATSYRMISGQTPFQGASVRDLVNKKVREDPKPLHECDPQIPRRVSDVIQKMMARDPQTRYQTMQEVIAEMEKVERELAGLPVDAKEGEATGPISIGNRKLLVAAVALLAIVLVGGIIGTAFVIKKKPPPKQEEESKGSNDDLALSVLTAAKQFARGEMDKTSPDSIRRGIKEYQSVIDKFPGTSYAEEAGKLRGDLEKTLRERLAAIKLEETEHQDVLNWNSFTQKFQPDNFDLTLIDSTIELYTKFAASEDNSGTPSAEEAGARVNHIVKWKRAVEKQRDVYAEKLLAANTARGQQKFKEAWNTLNDYYTEARNAAIECKFSNNKRYSYLLFDGPAFQKREDILTLAKAAYLDIKEKCAGLIAQAKFDEAMNLLEPVIKDSVEDFSLDAKTLRRDYEQKQAAWRAETERKAREEAAAVEKVEREAFEEGSRDAHALVLKYRFSEALAKLRNVKSKVKTEAMTARIDARIRELTDAFLLKDALKEVLKEGKFKKEFKWDKPDVRGAITRFTDTGFELGLEPSGTMDFQFTQFTPRGFYKFIKAGWQKMDPHDQCKLAIVCLEFGLYEEALTEIEAVAKSPDYAKDQPLQDFCTEYKKMILSGRYTEFDEIEAKKRFDRLATFIVLADYEAAKREIDVLRREYGKTQTFTQNQKFIDDALQKIGEKSTDDQKKKMKSMRAKQIDEAHAAGVKEARQRQTEVIERLNRMDDIFERNLHLGIMYAAHGEWSKSTEKWIDAQKQGEKLTANRAAGRELLPVLGYIYLGLYRNAYMMNNKELAKQVRNEGDRKFFDEKNQQEADWWKGGVEYIGYWAQKKLPADKAAFVDRLLKDLNANPEDPDRIWALAEGYSDNLQDSLNARGYYAFLFDNHPDCRWVRSGECLYRLAEILYGFLEVREALSLYRRLQDEYKDHPKVKDGKGDDGVRRRTEECLRLMDKMGYPREKKERGND